MSWCYNEQNERKHILLRKHRGVEWNMFQASKACFFELETIELMLTLLRLFFFLISPLHFYDRTRAVVSCSIEILLKGTKPQLRSNKRISCQRKKHTKRNCKRKEKVTETEQASFVSLSKTHSMLVCEIVLLLKQHLQLERGEQLLLANKCHQQEWHTM